MYFAAAMKDYFYARALSSRARSFALAEASLNEAAEKLKQAEAKLAEVNAKLGELRHVRAPDGREKNTRR